MKSLTGKKALVLGGSRGIGAATVKRLTEEGAEVTFTFNHSHEQALSLAEETASKAVKLDSSDRNQTTEFIESLKDLDILVVSAGVLVMGNPTELDPDQIDHMIDVNVRNPYHASVAAAKVMNDGGRIVIVGSVNADRIPMPGGAAYALSKSAIQGMVKGLARDLGARNITVNNVQPGPVNTDMNPEDGPMKEAMHSFMAIKRHARADEIAGMIAYLTGPDAAIVTGAQHTIDGGFGA